MAFREFCCRSGGSNLNAGTRNGSSTEPGTSADLTYASGNWVQSTGVFTVASGNPVTDGVAVGDYASVYANGASETAFVGKITARTSTTITVSTLYKLGSGAPTDGTGNRTLKVGGAWQGPNGSSGFPLTLAGLDANTIGENSIVPRVNMKNDATYSITATITVPVTQALVIQGYTTSYGDFGRATIDGGTSGASYTLLTASTLVSLLDLIFAHNGATGSADLVSAGSVAIIARCVFHDSRGSGLTPASTATVVECEAYACNASNTASKGGFYGDAKAYIRCISHDNTGSNTYGFYGSGTYVRCIADTNGGDGYGSFGGVVLICSEAYNNGGDGVQQDGYGAYIENTNLLKNGGYGVRGPNNVFLPMVNCGLGSGSQANTSGNVTGYEVLQIGSVTYASGDTPWVDPANGDFRINLAAAEGAGRGTFTETAAGYAGTVGYPDIGAAQHQDAGGGGGGLKLAGRGGLAG